VEIVSFEARDPDAGDAIFSTGDEIGIGFNIPTNQADLPNEMISRVQLESVFTFTMSMGLDFIGRWVSPTSLRITILNATVDRSSSLSHPPYVGFSGLSVSVKESGELYSFASFVRAFSLQVLCYLPLRSAYFIMLPQLLRYHSESCVTHLTTYAHNITTGSLVIGNLRNVPALCAASMTTSNFLSGDFGEPSIHFKNYLYYERLLCCVICLPM
jgi:hypothetical protein